MAKPATTMAEFRRKPDSQKRSLMIVRAKDAATSLITRYFYFSDVGGELPGTLGNYWHPMIDEIPNLSYNSREIGGMPTPSWSDAKLRNEDGYDISADRSGIYMEDLGTTWVIQDQPVLCYFGGDDLPFTEYAQTFTGICRGIKRSDSGPVLDLAGLENQIERKTVGTNKIDVATYPNCGANDGKSKPVAIGLCYNVEPPLVDSVTYRYMFHEGAGPTLFAVYANGKALGGGAYTDNLDGTFTLTAAPTGRITCTVFGAYFGSLWASMLSGVLQTWGGITLSQIDSAAVTAADIALPFAVGTYVQKETPVSDVIAELSDGIPAWYGFQKNGIFSMREVTDPALGTTDWETASVVSSEIPIAFLDGTLTVGQANTPIFRTNVSYYRNFSATTQNQLDPTLTENQKLAFILPFRKDYYTDTAVLTKYPNAGTKDIVFGTYTLSQAVSCATKWTNLLKVPRQLIRLTIKAMELRYEIGDIVEVTYKTELRDGSTWYRHGLNATKLMITGITENYSRAEITLELWG